MNGTWPDLVFFPWLRKHLSKGDGTLLHRGGLYFIFHPKWSKLGTILQKGPNIVIIIENPKFSTVRLIHRP